MRSDAQENRLRLVRATRDVVGWAGSPDISVREIAAAAGVSLATLYRHFDGRQALIDEVSIRRWSRMADLACSAPDQEPVDHVLRVIETFTRMTTEDHRFILGAGIEVGKKPVEHIRAEFEPHFARSWVAAQSSGHIRRTADPRDAIDMAGAIRDPRRRISMLGMLAGGICTDRVDVVGFVSKAVSRHWK
ncbi:TetR/AcrR family transcriptional regulator [Geodermatophilus sp. SYSU D00703]